MSHLPGTKLCIFGFSTAGTMSRKNKKALKLKKQIKYKVIMNCNNLKKKYLNLSYLA